MLGKLLDGRYQVIQVLGGGGFGQTYIAQDLRRPGYPKCVVKHLKPVTHNPKFLETTRRLFTSEAETLEQLGNHDQIPRLLAYFEENQDLFLVEEFIEGHSLEAELLPGQRWTEGQVIQLLQQVLGILEFVHRHQVIHRDITPNNIIRRKQDGKLVLIDFGAVKQIQTQLTVIGQMNATIAIGTPGYMSTEQGRGRPRPNSDIYSLGIIGIQALTGLHPSQIEEDPNTGEILWQHHAHVSRGLAAVLSKMVLHYFKERYQSATEVREALRQIYTKTIVQSTQQAIAFQPPLHSTLQPHSLSRQNAISVLPASGPPPGSILYPEQYNRLEKILVELVGSTAPNLLRQVAVSALSYEQVIDCLALHLDFYQQIELKKRAMFLLRESPGTSGTKVDTLTGKNTQEITENFVSQCERELTDLIGPIAPFLVKKAVKSSPQISRTEFVKILVAEIPNSPQEAWKFQQRLLSASI